MRKEEIARGNWLDDEVRDYAKGDPAALAQWEAVKLKNTLLAIRKERQVTQTELAELLHVQQSRIATIEKDPAKVSFERLAEMLGALGYVFEIVPREKMGVREFGVEYDVSPGQAKKP